MLGKPLSLDTGKPTWATTLYICPDCNGLDLTAFFTYCPFCGKTLNWIDVSEPQQGLPFVWETPVEEQEVLPFSV